MLTKIRKLLLLVGFLVSLQIAEGTCSLSELIFHKIFEEIDTNSLIIQKLWLYLFELNLIKIVAADLRKFLFDFFKCKVCRPYFKKYIYY